MSRLKELRKEKGYTQVKMQLLTGIDQSDYSKIENGKRYYTFEQCRKIALALETSMDYLAGLTDEKNEENYNLELKSELLMWYLTKKLKLTASDDEIEEKYNEYYVDANVDSPEEMKKATLQLLEATAAYPNFVLSSGCDIPPYTPLANINAFYTALEEFNETRN